MGNNEKLVKIEEPEIKIDVLGFQAVQARKGISLLELSKEFKKGFRSDIVAAKVDNVIEELTEPLVSDCSVEFIDLTDEDGMRIYRRSLYFVLIKAASELFPGRKLIMRHPISKGLYCELEGLEALTEKDVAALEQRMKEIVARNIPFKKMEISLAQAREIFEKSGRMDRFRAIEYMKKDHVTVYNCDGVQDYFYGYMVPHTGYIKTFGLKFYSPGLIIRFPEKSDPGKLPEFIEQKKLFTIIAEYKRWTEILNVDNVGPLNSIISEGKTGELIRVTEALHEKKIAQIADMITFHKNKKRVVLISGPSSSGKTTFANRLAIQLRVNGLRPVTISLDDYFVNRELTPRDEKGDFDFEALEAIDIKLFNEHLLALIEGREARIPVYNFQTGCRGETCRFLKISDEHILVIEGIHGLNERLTASIPRENKFKVYVSALTSMNIDDHNRVPSTDTRVIRRIVRDHKFRGYSAEENLKRWASVRRGEERNIFPFQEEADVMFNSSLVYEHSVLKPYAEPLLTEIGRYSSTYSEAKRLIEFLGYFLPADSKEVPQNSIMREFIGGSCFY